MPGEGGSPWREGPRGGWGPPAPAEGYCTPPGLPYGGGVATTALLKSVARVLGRGCGKVMVRDSSRGAHLCWLGRHDGRVEEHAGKRGVVGYRRHAGWQRPVDRWLGGRCEAGYGEGGGGGGLWGVFGGGHEAQAQGGTPGVFGREAGWWLFGRLEKGRLCVV